MEEAGLLESFPRTLVYSTGDGSISDWGKKKKNNNPVLKATAFRDHEVMQ